MMERTILVVDDEMEIVELIELYLVNNGFKVEKAFDGIQALEMLNEVEIDLAIIDIMMPRLDGYELIKKMRENMNIPIIILSAKVEGYDKILGLGLGADDYMTKPFDPLELIARVNAQLRRFHQLNGNEELQTQNVITVEDIVLNKNMFIVSKGGKEIILTPTEFKLLELFMENVNRLFTKRQLFEAVWQEPYYGEDNAIMVHISKLRDKIEEDSKNPKYLKTIRGLGYKFEGKK